MTVGQGAFELVQEDGARDLARLLAAGVPLKVVSQRVADSSPVVTMTIYQHVLPGDDGAAAALGANAILGTG